MYKNEYDREEYELTEKEKRNTVDAAGAAIVTMGVIGGVIWLLYFLFT